MLRSFVVIFLVFAVLFFGLYCPLLSAAITFLSVSIHFTFCNSWIFFLCRHSSARCDGFSPFSHFDWLCVCSSPYYTAKMWMKWPLDRLHICVCVNSITNHASDRALQPTIARYYKYDLASISTMCANETNQIDLYAYERPIWYECIAYAQNLCKRMLPINFFFVTALLGLCLVKISIKAETKAISSSAFVKNTQRTNKTVFLLSSGFFASINLTGQLVCLYKITNVCTYR